MGLYSRLKSQTVSVLARSFELTKELESDKISPNMRVLGRIINNLLKENAMPKTTTAKKPKKLKTEDLLNAEVQIRELAYYKWEQAGCPEGDGLSFWIEAEKEVLNMP
jgi:hypothetical protein